MNNQIQITKDIIGDEIVNSVNARELHCNLGIKKQFSDWIKSQINTLGLEENIDFITVHFQGYGGKFGGVDYIITLDTAKHISMASRTEKGKETRKYFIDVEKRFTKSQQKEIKEIKQSNAGRIAGLTNGIAKQKIAIAKLKDELAREKEKRVQAPLFIEHKSFDDNLQTLIDDTLKELNSERTPWSFLQNRANYFAKYVNYIKNNGTDDQKYKISEIERYKTESIKAQKELVIVEQKLENLKKVVDDYTNISNMLLKARYVS